MSLISIGEVAAILGVSVVTLRRWDRSGKLKSATRTFGNHRRYERLEVERSFGLVDPSPRKTVCYARVSSHDQKDDLKRQEQRLALFCDESQIVDYEVISDLGSGLNFKKPGLLKLLKMILIGNVGHLVITDKDRLLRFGADLVFRICDFFGTKVTVINSVPQTSREIELAPDVIEIITVFSAKLYGARSRKNLKSIANPVLTLAGEPATESL